FYERTDSGSQEPEALAVVLGPKPSSSKQTVEDFDERIVSRGGPIVVLNDEAHHTHDEDSEWNKLVRRLGGRTSGGLGHNSISRLRRGTPRASYFHGRSTTTRSRRRSSTGW